MDYAAQHAVEGNYQIEISEGFWLRTDLSMTEMRWMARVVFIDSKGVKTPTSYKAETSQAGDPNKRIVRARLLNALTRLKAYRQQTGKRWEIEQKEKREAEKAARLAAREAATAEKKPARTRADLLASVAD
ncbi:hypothetical protein BB934_45380 (plasmid) [Microvirga ossetica]|uniref:Uncharacterized protein n=1 Tax=Microvirga ossetica TaxID=1882682 RepID=A0A1B2EZU0_9HYPH|nr:hypothetical protein [Microvirga ossetica]ANY85454.1 hypothetical protein BB934_45380 [Microvirga ossetica]